MNREERVEKLNLGKKAYQELLDRQDYRRTLIEKRERIDEKLAEVDKQIAELRMV